MMNAKVAVVVLNYRNAQDTIECLESILNSSYNDFIVYVVDNASPDNSMHTMQQWAQSKQIAFLSCQESEKDHTRDLSKYALVFIQTQDNGGYAAGNNVGIKFALNDAVFQYIWILNNDTVVPKDTLQNVLDFATKTASDLTGIPLFEQSTQRLQAYCGHIDKYTGKSSYVTDKRQIGDPLNYIHGASMFIKTDTFSKIGLLPEEYFLYYEEVDFCFNARKHGLKIGIAEKSKVYHKEKGAQYSQNSDIDILKLTNRIIFYKKYFSCYFGLYIGVGISLLYKVLTGRALLAMRTVQYLLRDVKK